MRFHLGGGVATIEGKAVVLDDDSRLAPDLVVGVGVTPRTELAEVAGLAVDGGVLV